MSAEPGARADAIMAKARKTHQRVNVYAWLGAVVCVGLAVTLVLGFWDLPRPAVLEYGTAMVMIAAALAVLSVGLVAALFAARSALTAVESYSEIMALEASHHADQLAAMQSRRADRQAYDLQTLSAQESRQADAILAVKADVERDHDLVRELTVREERFEQKVDEEEEALVQELRSLRELEGRLADRLARGERATQERMEAVQGRMDGDRADWHSAVAKVLAEERERKEEFEALAAEEVRLMGRVRRTETLAKGEPGRMAEYYRISRPKASHRGPFGEVYPVAEVEGVTAARAHRLKEFGLTNTEHLWRANPTFVAALLHCDTKDVQLWQEEAELMAVNGIGRERAKILVEAGVTSIAKLGEQEPEGLMRMVSRSGPGNGSLHGGITVANAAKWIESAHHMRATA